ncbi:hypothetical protein P8C59_007705 [Phyllachora maydis]|uniref:3-beta hydroxysteroid dehydrogenase/isomerase domain-containing protein n=1 Tax=Phyllachora maydis TaxID=1825666 RepID=A0AAD9IA14_9PEZI|nr:hypothetical protein P8C59_007705 [Phyllachora maydis]
MELASLAAVPLLALLLLLLLLAYLVRLNGLMSGTPDEVRQLSPTRWTPEQLRETYRRLEANPITPATYRTKIPAKLERRYIVTGGSGLVGGYIILQLLERGTPPAAIRNVDFQPPHRADMLTGAAASVPHQPVDIASAASTRAAFAAPWDAAVAGLPLTVFHAAAVIVPSDRSPRAYGLCEAVNVRGTRHVVDAARAAGADVLVATTSGSIALRPVRFWKAPWHVLAGRWPDRFWQLLDERDFFAGPVRPRHHFHANYSASKAEAERIVCAANQPALRTGCIRPANSVYGILADTVLGVPLQRRTCPQWIAHITQSFAHGANVAVAHLQLEAVLAPGPGRAGAPQAGRPFVVTDPNGPITYGDLYAALTTLVRAPLRRLRLAPLPVLLLAHAVEAYCDGRAAVGAPAWLPPVTGELGLVKPAIFSIVTHLIARSDAAARSVADGGLAYTGVVTTLDGMVMELVEWNWEMQAQAEGKGKAKGDKAASITRGSSLSLADELQRLAVVTTSVGG